MLKKLPLGGITAVLAGGLLLQACAQLPQELAVSSSLSLEASSLPASSASAASTDEDIAVVSSPYVRVSQGKLVVDEGAEYIMYGINSTDNYTDYFHDIANSPEFYAACAAYEMNTVRICTNFQKYETLLGDGTVVYREEGFAALKQSVQNAGAVGLRVIIDMHQPQGGLQSFRNGTALFYDKELQQRFINLWVQLASRFANDPTVLGYGLCNEPVVPWYGSQQAAVQGYAKVLQRTIDAIRTVDTNHMLIVQMAGGYFDETVTGAAVQSSDVNWGILPMPELTDPQNNILPEFHMYKDKDLPYGGDVFVEPFSYVDIGEALAANVETQEMVWYDRWRNGGASDVGQWIAISAEVRLASGDIAALNPLVCMTNLPTNAVVYFDDLQIYRKSAGGGEELLWQTDYAASYWAGEGNHILNTKYLEQNPWQAEDGLLRFTSISGSAEGDSRSLLTRHAIVIDKAYTYRFTARVRVENAAAQPEMVFFKMRLLQYERKDHSKPTFLMNNQEWITTTLDYIESVASHYDAPVYLGELGANMDGYSETSNYEAWFRDIAAQMEARHISFTWHSANGGKYGLWDNDENGRMAREIPDRMFRKYFMTLNDR